jgi:hypothetical protein
MVMVTTAMKVEVKTNVIIFLELTLLHDVNGFRLSLIRSSPLVYS